MIQWAISSCNTTNNSRVASSRRAKSSAASCLGTSMRRSRFISHQEPTTMAQTCRFLPDLIGMEWFSSPTKIVDQSTARTIWSLGKCRRRKIRRATQAARIRFGNSMFKIKRIKAPRTKLSFKSRRIRGRLGARVMLRR